MIYKIFGILKFETKQSPIQGSRVLSGAPGQAGRGPVFSGAPCLCSQPRQILTWNPTFEKRPVQAVRRIFFFK